MRVENEKSRKRHVTEEKRSSKNQTLQTLRQTHLEELFEIETHTKSITAQFRLALELS